MEINIYSTIYQLHGYTTDYVVHYDYMLIVTTSC